MQDLPVDAHLPAIVGAIATAGAAVVTAAPGAGKSTRIPPALLDPRLLDPDHPRVLVLQPRRVAAMGLARRIADERGWQLGAEVGHRVRFDQRGKDSTRLWLETEGTLTRQLLADPLLEGVGAVVLDEFHERSWHADLALAWLRELRRDLRPELKLLVMSATLAAEPVAAFLGDEQTPAPVIAVPGQLHPVRLRHQPPQARERLPEQVVRAVRQALDEEGDLLVFLPGVGEIHACEQAIRQLAAAADCDVLPLHGSLSGDEQLRALRPGPRRRIVLATNVAETSVTVEGVRLVIDSGVARIARFDPDRGLDTLGLEDISQFSAEQRQGRAGRQGPGHCWRLCARLADRRRKQALEPELRRVDLAPVLLACKRLHGADTQVFPWFEPPDTERHQQAEDLLALLGFTAEPQGPLTGLGKLLADLPVHPRLARLLLEAGRLGCQELGCQIAALLSERDVRRFDRAWRAGAGPHDMADRLDLLAEAEAGDFHPRLRQQGVDTGAARQVSRVASQLRRLIRDLPAAGVPPIDEDRAIARLLLAAYPDRVAVRKQNDGNQVRVAAGPGAVIAEGSALYADPGRAREPLLLAYALQGLRGKAGSRTLVQQACAVTEEDIQAVFGSEAISETEQLRYDAGKGVVQAARVRRFGTVTLAFQDGQAADPEAVAACLADALADDAEDLLRQDEAVVAYLQRWRWLAAETPESDWPPADAACCQRVLRQLCQGERRRADVLAKPDKLSWLKAELPFALQQRLDAWAPERLAVPSGNELRLDYSGPRPVLAVRIQELFSLSETPRLVDGRVPVLLHLLAPNFRPAQVTDDLASFWATTYAQVRKDLRGRYPKHSWPEDPLNAAPEAKGGRRR